MAQKPINRLLFYILLGSRHSSQRTKAKMFRACGYVVRGVEVSGMKTTGFQGVELFNYILQNSVVDFRRV